MVLEDILKRAIEYHKDGDLARAEKKYLRVLKADPESATALHFLGRLRHSQTRTEEALELIKKAVRIAPGYADAWNNLGNVHVNLAQLDEAREAYETALNLVPDDLNSNNNLGILLRHLGELDLSEHYLRRAVELAPGFAHAWYNLGNTLQAKKNFAEAMTMYRHSLTLDHRISDAWRHLGTSLYALGRIEDAKIMYEQWLLIDPENATAQHMYAACSGENVPARANDAYISKHFDEFAESFESQLAQLEYAIPKLIGEAMLQNLGPAQASLRILELGCGTGLCAQHLKPFARHLTGVDLSKGMLKKARERRIYNELINREIIDYLGSECATVDVVCSADTLIYFGDLEPVSTGVAQILERGGHFIFSVESFQSEDADCVLNPHGRYAHTRDYVTGILADCGIETVSWEEVVVRQELRVPVMGWLVVARRKA